MRSRLLLAASALASFAGCRTVMGIEELPVRGAGDDASDAVLDGGDAETDAAPDSPDAGPGAVEPCPGNLLLNPTFDSAPVDWFGLNGELVVVADAGHGAGGAAARVCKDSNPATAFYAAVVDPNATFRQGERYHLSGWVRSESGQTQPLFASVEEDGVATEGAAASVAAEWQPLTVDMQIRAASPLTVRALLTTSKVVLPDNACFYLDDVCFRRTAP